MKLQCASCLLRMASCHFKGPLAARPQLMSICDICLQAGQPAREFANPAIAALAEVQLVTFVGTKATVGAASVAKTSRVRCYRKQYESFLHAFDHSELAMKQIPRQRLNQAVLASERGELPVPDLTRSLNEQLAQLGLAVTFQLNEVSYLTRAQIRMKYHHRCQYCGRRGDSIDHMDPVSRSHNNTLANLTLACHECNRTKGDMPYAFFCRLNAKLSPINQQLVAYEQTLTALKSKLQAQRQALAAEVHLHGVIQSPSLNQQRQVNKQLQDVLDSLQSDYEVLCQQRRDYLVTSWQLAQAQERGDII
ncbi:MAG: HNH endonuclease [Lactobacillus sp.]